MTRNLNPDQFGFSPAGEWRGSTIPPGRYYPKGGGRLHYDTEHGNAEMHFHPKRSTVEVPWLGMPPAMQRHGVGSAMLDTLQAMHPDKKLKFVEPNAKAKGMIKKFRVRQP